jgi:predicted nucleic acid-binding protein
MSRGSRWREGMGVKWLLDTNACMAIIRRRPESALKRLRGKQVGQVGVSSLTLAELEFGRSQEPASGAGAGRTC